MNPLFSNPLEMLARFNQQRPSMPPAQATMPPAEKPQINPEDDPSFEDLAKFRQIPFYPSERHIKYNLAPEKSLYAFDLKNIAEARRQAEDTGVLSSELAEHFLPIAMVEGWGSGMGVKGGQNFYASRRFQDFLNKMDLKEDQDYLVNYIKGEKHIQPIEGEGNGPWLAAAILAEKAAVARSQGDLSIEGAIKRYNGKGKGLEDMGHGEFVPANVDTYWKKIQEASKLLSHPLNSSFFNHFKKAYGR